MAAALQRLKDSREEGMLELIEEIISQLLGCEEYALFAVEEDGQRLVPVAAMGLSLERFHALLVPQGIVGQVARHGVQYIVGRTSSIGAGPHEVGMTACIPLISRRQVMGVLVLFRMLPQKRGINEEDLELMDLLSERGVAALVPRPKGVVVPRAPVLPPPFVADPGGVRTVYLEPGGLVAAARPTEVTTILGSCVAVCLWDEQLHVGGVNHFLLPSALVGQQPGGRHGDAAIPMLLRELERMGSQRKNLRAKLFGGAHMAGPPVPGAKPGLGQRNAELARQMLEELGIPILATDLGGGSGRKLRFRTDDGTALIKLLGAG
ncbi:GAF domain-containing protein [Hyalangium versicolor]|uniref:GAF domain-containing protein n=1 Tax=Hyalangium versicolor TaxID=2861190 RepID=UPI001CCEBFD3|nr:GAF domain-containing protein [Hyalangium versicolor]